MSTIFQRWPVSSDDVALTPKANIAENAYNSAWCLLSVAVSTFDTEGYTVSTVAVVQELIE